MAALEAKKTESKFRAITKRKNSVVISSNLDLPPSPPALLTRTSILPYFSPIFLMLESTSSSLVTSNP